MRVISVRYPSQIKDPYYVYVGHNHPSGHERHLLANPFVKEANRVDLFRDWLANHPDRERLLAEVWQDTEGGVHPLACWCGEWEPGQVLDCHAVAIAEAVEEQYAELLCPGF